MSTILPGSLTLTPIATVDTASAATGISMFTLNFDSELIDTGNVIQFEYLIYNANTPFGVQNGNGFIAPEDVATTQGIANQYSIAIPWYTNNYAPNPALSAKVRLYIGETKTAGPEIKVSDWSNSCPFHSAPPQPEDPIAYLYRGEYPYASAVEDLLYVTIQNNQDYTVGEIDFIISYSYKDVSGNNKWIVSPPISDWESNLDPDIIKISPIILESDVYAGSPIYVAVNAIFNYTFNNKNYYSVSEISVTVTATDASYGAPILAPITTDDYLIYGDSREQIVVLNWASPVVGYVIPSFSVASYKAELIVNAVVVATIDDISGNDSTYNFQIPEQYYTTVNSTTLLTYKIIAVYITGETLTSNPESINTFTYATQPENFIVDWANESATTGRYDIAIEFNNPSSIGFGTNPRFIVNVLDPSGDIVYTQNETYNINNSRYIVYLNNVLTTSTGTIQVYMVTNDTNQTDGIALARNGDSDTQNYVSSELPFIINIETDIYNNLSFDVITSSALDLIGRFIYYDPLTSQLNSDYTFNTQPGSYKDGTGVVIYIVSLSTIETGDNLYHFEFYPTYTGVIVFPEHLGILVSNQVGIGYGTEQTPALPSGGAGVATVLN